MGGRHSECFGLQVRDSYFQKPCRQGVHELESRGGAAWGRLGQVPTSWPAHVLAAHLSQQSSASGRHATRDHVPQQRKDRFFPWPLPSGEEHFPCPLRHLSEVVTDKRNLRGSGWLLGQNGHHGMAVPQEGKGLVLPRPRSRGRQWGGNLPHVVVTRDRHGGLAPELGSAVNLQDRALRPGPPARFPGAVQTGASCGLLAPRTPESAPRGSAVPGAGAGALCHPVPVAARGAACAPDCTLPGHTRTAPHCAHSWALHL